MNELWVLDASPIILFAHIDRLDIVQRLAPSLGIPDAVLREVGAGSSVDPSTQAALDWGVAFRVNDVALPASVIAWNLGAGESQVVAQCCEPGRMGVLDDRMGRRCASAHNVPLIGSLGIILRAKRYGLIDAAKPIIEQMKTHGMYISVDVEKEILAAVGE